MISNSNSEAHDMNNVDLGSIHKVTKSENSVHRNFCFASKISV